MAKIHLESQRGSLSCTSKAPGPGVSQHHQQQNPTFRGLPQSGSINSRPRPLTARVKGGYSWSIAGSRSLGFKIFRAPLLPVSQEPGPVLSSSPPADVSAFLAFPSPEKLLRLGPKSSMLIAQQVRASPGSRSGWGAFGMEPDLPLIHSFIHSSIYLKIQT
jgi:hypothetical protein